MAPLYEAGHGLGRVRCTGSNREDRAGSCADDGLRSAAKQQMGQSGASMRPHDDEIDFLLTCHPENRISRLAISNPHVHSYALFEPLACDLVQLRLNLCSQVDHELFPRRLACGNFHIPSILVVTP
jgi:hypothetical protein